MDPLLTQGKVYKLRKLLPMKYKVSEIAAFLGVTTDTIYRSYLPAGAPVLREGNVIWIVGTELQNWAREYLAGKKLKLKTMSDNQVYCSSCHLVAEMISPRVVEVNKLGVARVAARCGLCNARVSRFMKKTRDGGMPREALGASKPGRDKRFALVVDKLINRQNYDEVQEFLRYQREIRQNDPQTLELYFRNLEHLMFWAWDKELRQAPAIRPGLIEYLEALRLPPGDKPISAAYFTKMCRVIQQFFKYHRDRHRNAYTHVTADWIESIHPPRLRSEQAQVKKREYYSREDAIKLATCPTTTLRQKRTQAGVAFLFLSGMRIAAFMSLPISCVDLENLKVDQFPQLGVKTKNKKAATTTILLVPELLEVARAWDARVRAALPAERCWYPNLERSDIEAFSSIMETEKLRGKSFHEDLRELCALAGVRYLSPHKFRHGHAMYGLDRANTRQEIKAVSQNLMHANIGITDQIYGGLLEEDQHATMLAISGKEKGKADAGLLDYERLAETIARKMRGE